MYIVLGLAVGVAAGYLIRRNLASSKLAGAEREAEKLLRDAKREAETVVKEARLEAKEEVHRVRGEVEAE
ncbi:MAG TPA: Rnase Y domain-containing protein, partial [Thermoleophilia bacterium]